MIKLSDPPDDTKGTNSDFGQSKDYETEIQPGTQSEKVPLRHYSNMLLSSIGVILAFIVISMALAFLLTKLITPTYRVTTTIMVGKANLGQTSNYDTIMAGEDLARTYAEMITSRDLLEQVSQQLNSKVSPGELRNAITVTPITNTQLIEISVEQSDPALLVKIADSLVTAFSSKITQGQLDSAAYQDSSLENQLKEIEGRIVQLQEDIKENSIQLHEQRLKAINAAIEDLRNQIAQTSEEVRRAELSALLLEYQKEYVSRSIRGPVIDMDNFTINQDATALEQYKRDYQLIEQNYSDLKFTRLQNMVLVERIDQPVTPEKPVRPNLLINLVLGFAIGLLLGIIYISFRNNYGSR